MMGGRKKDCAGDRRKANSKMTAAAAAADDVAARLRFSRARMICMVELLCWHFDGVRYDTSFDVALMDLRSRMDFVAGTAVRRNQ